MQSTFVFIDNYQNEVDAEQWKDWLEHKRFEFRSDKEEDKLVY